MNCPYTKEECPEHNKKGGCAWWMEYHTTRKADADVHGCAMILTPMLLIEVVNGLGGVAFEVSKSAAETSAGRVENIKTWEALRTQLLALAQRQNVLIQPDYSATGKIEQAKGNDNGKLPS